MPARQVEGWASVLSFVELQGTGRALMAAAADDEGDGCSLVIREGGELVSFGCGDSGLLGHGDEETQLVPKVVEGLDSAAS